MVLILIILAVVACFLLFRRHKKINLPDVTLISGGVKTGKSTLAFTLAYKAYRRICFKILIKNLFRPKKNKIELPLFYSNIPLKVPHVRLTPDIIYMRERVVPQSVLFIDEASLLCDSMDFKNNEKNESVKLFFKLWGHISHGGKCFLSTHTPKDVHYNIKRSLANYLFIVKAVKWIPFYYVVNVREMIYSEENVQNIYNDDIGEDDTSYWLICPKRYWKLFDCYCYSALVDNLQCDENVVIDDNLKTSEVLTFEN